MSQYFAVVILGALLNMVFNVLAQGALVRATIASSHGERATFGECLSTALGRLLPLLGQGIVSGPSISNYVVSKRDRKARGSTRFSLRGDFTQDRSPNCVRLFAAHSS